MLHFEDNMQQKQKFSYSANGFYNSISQYIEKCSEFICPEPILYADYFVNFLVNPNVNSPVILTANWNFVLHNRTRY